MAFHPRPQIASNLGRKATRSSRPHRHRKRFPSGYEIFGLRPQIQIAAGLNLLRFDNCKPNPPHMLVVVCQVANPQATIAELGLSGGCNRRIASHKITKYRRGVVEGSETQTTGKGEGSRKPPEAAEVARGVRKGKKPTHRPSQIN